MECLRNLLVFFLWMHTTWKLDGLTVSQPVLLEAESTGEATLECTHNCDENVEIKLTILKGWKKNVICTGTTNRTILSANSTTPLHCQIKRKPHSVSATLSGLNSSLIDNYFCKIEKLYPPPYESNLGNGTIIYSRNENCVKCSQSRLFQTMGILGTLTLFCMIYSIVLTLIFCASKKTIKKEEENTVYERMAPSTGTEQNRRNNESAASLARKY
ncbi:T-cell-specific surface glycoprotein CD28 homolog [Heterodontus francisci]|uniref:T-cell-specific surface glycoprotein CD28 homolog n=1 Tax=Heterodontus francisci TaxID=7792 RepID=UPI00355B6CE9